MKTTNRPRNQTSARNGHRSYNGAHPRNGSRSRNRRQPTTAWIEQQRLMAIPTEWEIDPQTCKIGLEAIANIRAMFKAAEAIDDDNDLPNIGAGIDENLDSDLVDQPSTRQLPVGV